MKVNIKGEAICETQVVVSSENEVIYKGILHYSDCVFDVQDEKGSCLKFHFAQFEGVADSLEERSEIAAMNEDIIMTELQYPYDTQIEISPSMESLFLIPEKMKEFEDFIVFVPDQDIKVNYLRNENEDKIKEIIDKHLKRNRKTMCIAYPLCLLISIPLFYIGNTTESYTIMRLLGFPWFALLVIPPIAFFHFRKDFLKAQKFLLRNTHFKSSNRGK